MPQIRGIAKTKVEIGGLSLENGSLKSRLADPLGTKRNLYLIEEPTVGLHREDVQRLIEVLHRLVDEGHTVVVIEHQMAVAAEADWILDLGPDAGEAGGTVVAKGTPEKVMKSATSRTAPFLRQVMPGGTVV